MGKNLHYLIIKFFEERMSEHDKVASYRKLYSDSNILYFIKRLQDLPDLTVHLSDAYRYTLHDYYSKPSAINAGDFILIARPEAKFDNTLVEIAFQDGIGVGKIGKFLGALNKVDVSTYHKEWI